MFIHRRSYTRILLIAGLILAIIIVIALAVAIPVSLTTHSDSTAQAIYG